jgi:hypothetical protein
MSNSVRVCVGLALVLLCGVAGVAVAGDDKPAPANGARPEAPTPEQVAASRSAFLEVTKVLQHPRCMNCHPAGDAPLQTDASRRHQMNVSRLSVEAGLACATCHQDKNSEELGVKGGPPGAPHWGLPPKEMPMVFQGHTPASLCAQLVDPARNGNRSLGALLEHASHDPLVLWAWKPGGNRTRPPMSHSEFVQQFRTWVAGGGACPEAASTTQ